MGFFKPINNIISDLIRNLDKVSINQLVTLIVDNILYGFLILHLQSTVLSNKQLMINPPSYNSLFQTPSIPFLPTIQEASYTLVLDLDETLVHSSFKVIFQSRQFFINSNFISKACQ